MGRLPLAETRLKYLAVRKALIYINQHLPSWLQKAAWQYQPEEWTEGRLGIRAPEMTDQDLVAVLRALRPSLGESGAHRVVHTGDWDASKQSQIERMIQLKGNESSPDGTVHRSTPASWFPEPTEQTLDRVIDAVLTDDANIW